MNQEIVVRTILSNVIDQYINAIAADPDRSIRKLVDMAERVSDGHFQKIFYQMMQKMAANIDSPYYKLLYEMVRRIDPKTIKTTGINIGYNSWTLGARTIRRIEKEKGQFIPWTILFNREGTESALPFSEVERLVSEARANAVYAFFIHYPQETVEWDACLELFKKHSDCAFTLILPPTAISENQLDELEQLHNLCILLDTSTEDWQQSATQLLERHSLFGIYREYETTEEVNDILSGEWIEEALQFYPTFAFCLAGKNCLETEARKVREYIRSIRMDQSYPVMPVDMISDFTVISSIISNQEHCLAVFADGTVLREAGSILRETDLNAKGQNFIELNKELFQVHTQ